MSDSASAQDLMRLGPLRPRIGLNMFSVITVLKCATMSMIVGGYQYPQDDII